MSEEKKSSLNYQAMIVALPEHGKSTLLRQIADDHAQRGAWVFVHDLAGDWAREWSLPVFETTEAWWAEFVRTKGKMHKAASFACPSGELVALLVKLGKLFNNPVQTMFPMFAAFDEGALIQGSGKGHQGADIRELSALRRHRGVALAFNVQTVGMLTDDFFVMTTHIFVMGVNTAREAERVEVRCGLPEGAAAGLVGLPPFRYLLIQPGKGIIAERSL